MGLFCDNSGNFFLHKTGILWVLKKLIVLFLHKIVYSE